MKASDLYYIPSRPVPGRREKVNMIFVFTHLFAASEGFMKVLKAFTKPFDASQRSLEIKIQVNFHFNTAFWNARDDKD